jgi:hypothetical protein
MQNITFEAILANFTAITAAGNSLESRRFEGFKASATFDVGYGSVSTIWREIGLFCSAPVTGNIECVLVRLGQGTCALHQ